MYPVTPTLSVAVKEVIGISKDVEGDVAAKAVTVGACVSGAVSVVYENT